MSHLISSSNGNHACLESAYLLFLLIYVFSVVGGRLWSAVILCDPLLSQMSYLKILLLPMSPFKQCLWTLDHILGYGKRCPHQLQPSYSQAKVWLLLVVLAMDSWRSLLKPNMVLNQIYKCLGVLWKTHMQAALAKPDCVYVYVWVHVSVCERGQVKAYKATEGESCVK